jgi:hypothetical protein
VPLSDLVTLLRARADGGGRERIAAYGVVLGFSPPSLTRTEQWKVTLVLVDDTLPLAPTVAATEQEGGTVRAVDDRGGSAAKEPHIPSVTLNLFERDRARLPVIEAAGDVVCCEGVVLQEWQGEPQLCGWGRGSHVVVVRPARTRRPGDGAPCASTRPGDYTVSSSRRPSALAGSALASGEGVLHWPLIDHLWRWGQWRLASHPTMSARCALSLTGAGECHARNSHGHGDGRRFEEAAAGDLTAAVTAIVPVPERWRRRDTPRGYLRLWDGTGPSRSDP